MAHGSGFWVLAPSQDQPKLLSPDLAVALFCLQTAVLPPEPEGEGRPLHPKLCASPSLTYSLLWAGLRARGQAFEVKLGQSKNFYLVVSLSLKWTQRYISLLLPVHWAPGGRVEIIREGGKTWQHFTLTLEHSEGSSQMGLHN